MAQTEPETKTFTESQMMLLRRVVDCLIPAEGDMPPASLVGTAEYIDAIASGDDLTKFPFLTGSAGSLDSDSVYIDRPKLRRLLLEGLKEIEDKVIESTQGESEFISSNTLVLPYFLHRFCIEITSLIIDLLHCAFLLIQ